MADINIRNIVFGGLADSDYLGADGSVSDLYQLDIHSEPGLIKLNQKLTAISQAGLGGNTIDTPIVSIVYVPYTKYADAGHTTWTYGFFLAFGSNGKVWALTVSNQTTREVDGIQYLGQVSDGFSNACRGAIYFNEYVYYIGTYHNLGRMGVSSPIDVPAVFSGKNDVWQTTMTSAGYRPMTIVNDTLYIGNAQYVASVTSAAAFNATALDIDIDMVVSTLDQYNTDLCIGSISAQGSTFLNKVKYYRWNTTAASFSFDDLVFETGIRSVVPMDNDILVITGIRGNTYTFNGNQLDMYKRLKGSWGFGDTARAYNSYCRANFLGKPVFTMENTNNAPIRAGVWSFARPNKNYPYVFAYENDISSGNSGALVSPAAVCSVAYQMLVGWADMTSGSYVYGIDKYDSTAKVATGHFTTRYIVLNRTEKNNYAQIFVPYKSLPTNTAVKIYVEKNYAGSFTEITDKVTDTDRMMVKTKVNVGDANALRVKVELVGYQNSTPEIEGAVIRVT